MSGDRASSGGLAARVQVPGRVDAEVAARPGEVVAVIGPNGAGKTSLLHALSGLVPATGEALVDGVDLLALPVRERRVGLVFQDQALFPHLSALDNAAFGPRARGTRRADAETAALDWLRRLGVADLADRRPDQLSGGQAQRVAIARALATRPRVLLLDEPFAGLDVGVAAGLRLELGRHLADLDAVTLLVTHDALDAMTLADRVLVLDEGRVAQTGTPQEVAATPATEHVARLVGLNVVGEGDRWSAFTPSSVTVSVTEPHDSTRHRWHGRVRGVAPHGDAVRLGVEVAGLDRELLADVTPAATRDLGITTGSPVWLAVKETALRRDGAAPGADRDGS